MYIRFDTCQRDTYSRVGLGIMQTAGDVLEGALRSGQSWQHDALRRELRWFNRNLNIPDRLDYRLQRKGWRSGICWFNSAAAEHVTRARYIAWLLSDLGYPTRSLRSADPGPILWRDTHQIVALPTPIGDRPASAVLCH